MALTQSSDDGMITDDEPFDYQEYDKDSELTSFLEKEDLTSLHYDLSALNINLSYLQYVETDQLNILCDKLKLKIGSSTRLQFTRAVVKLQSELNQIKERKKHSIMTVDEKEKQDNHQQNSLSIKRLITPRSKKRKKMFSKDKDNDIINYNSDDEIKHNNNNNNDENVNTNDKKTESYTQTLQKPRPRGYDFLIKCILLGDSSVGKSCILVRYIDDVFKESSMFTVGIDYRMKTIELGDDLVKYQIWDTAGQEKYRTIISAYYRGIDCALLCYDITNRSSFENIITWIENVQQYSSDHVFMMLVGTKLDLVENEKYQREISTEEGQQLANEYGIKFCEVSSKTNHGISSLFLTTASYAILNKKEYQQKINKQRAITQEKIDMMAQKVIDHDEMQNTTDNKFVKKKCCNVYI